MTREQIRQDAEAIVRTACNLHRNAGLSEANAVVEAKLIVLVRATLEEAARAVCPDCGVGVRLLPQTAEWEYGHPDDDDYRYDCAACAIHDLIAALDKEASHE